MFIEHTVYYIKFERCTFAVTINSQYTKVLIISSIQNCSPLFINLKLHNVGQSHRHIRKENVSHGIHNTITLSYTSTS